MKFFIILTLLIFISLTTCKIIHIPTALPPHKCAYSCPNSDLTLCATNGQCKQEFQGECLMSAYNCEHPHKPFVIIEDWKCKQSGAAKCRENELEI
ncbi:uncharacterized protein LOC119603489 [Lucilia sericata]|uniref:uncharacterized protein LOC119603489 n=1 Tax=Lucilia sericata TaxID=13632 RepID=UPI0018A81E7F|nr:uncharacterized protein LOC119603489 [Lucilia sericata]